MILQNMNIFIIFSLLISILSLYFGIYSIILKPFRESSLSFSIYSFFIFLASISTFMSSLASNQIEALRWFYIFIISSFFVPVALLILISNFLGYKYVKKTYRYMLFLIPLAVSIILLLNRNINIVRSDYGYAFNIPVMNFIGPFYFTVISLGTIFILSLESFRRNRVNRSRISVDTFLAGIVIYTLSQTIYQVLLSMSLVPKIPSDAISTTLLYVFILISLFSIRSNINNISLTSAFKKIQDCILITDDKGDVLEMNDCMKKRLNLLDEGEKTSKEKQVKSHIYRMISNKKRADDFFKFLKSNSSDDYRNDLVIKDNKKRLTYNITISPILDKRNNILGRVSIFRDITQKVKYEKEIEYKSFHDELTGLYNRHFFDEELIRLDTERKLPISIILGDIDGLKSINDKYGHNEGDQLIIAVAKILKSSCRRSDIVSRWGGDEFIVLLPKTSENKVKKTLNRICQAYSGKSLNNMSPISVSFGCATKNNKEQDMRRIIETADKDMYINKYNKRKINSTTQIHSKPYALQNYQAV